MECAAYETISRGNPLSRGTGTESDYRSIEWRAQPTELKIQSIIQIDALKMPQSSVELVALINGIVQ